MPEALNHRKYCIALRYTIQSGYSLIDEPLSFFHYRDKDKIEVDLIIENGMGDCFAVEVKATATLYSKDVTGLKRFQHIAGKWLKLGILLYDGDHTTAFGDQVFAVPFGALWS